MKAVLNYNQFEEIILNPEKFQDWNNILKHHTDLELNISQDEIQILESDINSVLFHFINATGGKFCETFSKEIDVDQNPSYILFDKDFSNKNNGCLIIDKETLENPFKLNYAKILPHKSKIEFNSKKGWKLLFENKTLISNSLVINDSYIFDEYENKTKIGTMNIVNMLDSILPKELDVSYHILINTTNPKNKPNTFYDSFIQFLIHKIESIRMYKIKIEIVIGKGKDLHKRKLITNFLSITTDKGFKIFDVNDLSKVIGKNDVTIETMFTRNDQFQGDSQYDEMKILLEDLNNDLQNSIKPSNLSSLSTYTKTYYFSNFQQQEGKIEIRNRLFLLIQF
ncbi:hypothetical protein HXZ62_15515 [Empedobacter falsenii]|uniref:hypothetical protein n=1 Tax=Empedobacter falsenii TaxID=343874 RepID=UPI002578DCE4|nr:hypothetical protein [Empedobacter falsenii]MDM1063956.1 hypothetical protein [Empedobacter falsenii]